MQRSSTLTLNFTQARRAIDLHVRIVAVRLTSKTWCVSYSITSGTVGMCVGFTPYDSLKEVPNTVQYV